MVDVLALVAELLVPTLFVRIVCRSSYFHGVFVAGLESRGHGHLVEGVLNVSLGM